MTQSNFLEKVCNIVIKEFMNIASNDQIDQMNELLKVLQSILGESKKLRNIISIETINQNNTPELDVKYVKININQSVKIDSKPNLGKTIKKIEGLGENGKDSKKYGYKINPNSLSESNLLSKIDSKLKNISTKFSKNSIKNLFIAKPPFLKPNQIYNFLTIMNTIKFRLWKICEQCDKTKLDCNSCKKDNNQSQGGFSVTLTAFTIEGEEFEIPLFYTLILPFFQLTKKDMIKILKLPQGEDLLMKYFSEKYRGRLFQLSCKSDLNNKYSQSGLKALKIGCYQWKDILNYYKDISNLK